MLFERIDIIRVAGVGAIQVRFDLSDPELLAVARSVEAAASERYRGVVLDADDVLELRELTAAHDAALERAQDGYNGGTLVFSLRRLGLLAGALGEWVERRAAAGFMRADEAIDLPVIDGLIEDLRDLHVRGLQAALADPELAGRRAARARG